MGIGGKTMREDREIVLSEQEIQDICNDIGAK